MTQSCGGVKRRFHGGNRSSYEDNQGKEIETSFSRTHTCFKFKYIYISEVAQSAR